MFLKQLATKLPKHSSINIDTINLKQNKQPTYRPIYNLRLVELETFKLYIKTNLANGLI